MRIRGSVVKTRALKCVAAAVLAVGLAAVATPAMAAGSSFGDPSDDYYDYIPDGSVSSYYYRASSYGNFTGDCQYGGEFIPYSTINEVDWDNNGTIDECFGIAPDHTIWHAWRNSGGWQELLPYANGHADNMECAARVDGSRKIQVYVESDNSYWNAAYYTSHWHGWYGGKIGCN